MHCSGAQALGWDPALYTVSKMVRWILWRRFHVCCHSHGLMGEECTQAVLPTWDGHTQQVSDHRLSTVLPHCAMDSSCKSEMRHWAHPHSPFKAESWNMWDERLERDLASSQDMHLGKEDCFVPLLCPQLSTVSLRTTVQKLSVSLSSLPTALTLQAHWYSLLLEQVLVLLLLLLPVGLNRVLGKVLHQLQGLLDLQEHFVRLPAPHLDHGKRKGGRGGKESFKGLHL